MIGVEGATIFPLVTVPVSSEHKTDMQPRVLIVVRFLTRTFRRAMTLAMIVSDSATDRETL